MEGSFAHSVRLGYKRARARGLVNMKIQDYLVAAVQNLLILIRAKVRRTTKIAPVGLVGAVIRGRAAFARLLAVGSLFRRPQLILAAASS
jgi:hypothetical protein